jgi:hypothetical protein
MQFFKLELNEKYYNLDLLLCVIANIGRLTQRDRKTIYFLHIKFINSTYN